MADDQLLDTEQDQDTELQEFDPASLPLGTFAPFEVSDQPMWTTKEGPNQLTDDQKAAIKQMVDAAAKADSVARRMEVQGAWMLELLDRGFQRITPSSGGGWDVYGTGPTVKNNYGVFGNQLNQNFWDTNVIGEKNDIIVACLTREVAEAKFFPEKPGDPDDETYAQTADNLKHFIAEENRYAELQAEVARFFCTDECAVSYTSPVADAQRWGYQETPPAAVPEAQDAALDTGNDSDKPKIRTLSRVFGKLNRKVPIIAKSIRDWQYCGIAHEIDVALARGKYPWIAKKIKAGDMGIAEIQLDRVARQSINLSLQAAFATGDNMMRDCTESFWWFRPAFYTDDSCPKEQRSWFWQNFPKGFLCVYAANELAYIRNEGMDEVLNEFHARSGNGQNRRAITESYAGPQMRLNVLVDLWDEFCRKEIPRVGLDADVWNVDSIRSSSVRVGVYEPAKAPIYGQPLANSMAQFPQPQHAPTMPDFIAWLAGPLAEQLTHAMPALAASEGDDPETLGQSKLQNNNAMASFGESWKSILHGFANMTTQAVAWNARVQPDTEVFDSNTEGGKRIRAEIAKLKQGSGVARADGTANFPESWNDRQAAWMIALQGAESPMFAPIFQNPITLSSMKEFMPKGMVLPGVSAVEKQRAEFDVLLSQGAQPNPQYLQLQDLMTQAQQDPETQMLGSPQAQAFAQLQQMLQQTPEKLTSLPVLPTDDDANEAITCLEFINSAEGRKLSRSQDEDDQAHFENLMLHYQTHQQNADKKAAQNLQKEPPKVSISVDPSKFAPNEQAALLQLAGVPASAESIASDDALQPHEVTTKEKGITPHGTEVERTTSVVGKSLN